MTVTRFASLFILMVSPALAWAQNPAGARQDLNAGPRDQFALEAAANSGPGTFAGADGAYVSGPAGGLAPGLIPRQDGMPPPSIVPQGPQPPGSLERTARARQQFQSPIWQTTSRGGYFGMMGAVGRPGVYFQKSERALLNDVLRLAGGSTERASGGVRIVRQGHGGLQTFLSPNSHYELLNGDVVIVESNQQQGVAGLRQHSPTMHLASDGRQRSDEAVSPNGVKSSAYLAFVNLKAEPIIVPVPADQANLTNVMTWLRQDLKSPPSVRVIAPGPQVRRDVRVPAEPQLLESGTVLVFDPTTVKRERLPDFPAVIGEREQRSVEQSPVANPADAAARPSPNGRTTMPSLESPAGRATRVPPAQVPPPPPEAKPLSVPRRPLSQADSVHGNDSHSMLNGPMLMSPQRPVDHNSQATEAEYDPRPAVAPANLNDEQTPQPAGGPLRQQRLSWQSRPVSKVNRLAAHEGAEQGVVQAHVEQELPDPEAFAGPALELPRPVPDIVPDANLIQPEFPLTTPALAIPSSSSFSRQMVWFSLASIVLLSAILWCLLRWDRVRPLRARVLAGRRPSTGIDYRTNYKGRSVLMAERQQIFRTDVTLPQSEPQSNTAANADEAGLPTLPPPIRTVSQREHALRAHFRQAWRERGQRQPVPTAAGELEAESAPAQSSPPAAQPVGRPHVAQGSKPQDALQRALQAKRNDATTGPS